MEAAPRITKKQKKAIAFRANKGKGKKEADDQLEVPEQEDLDSIESNKPEKKRKRDNKQDEDQEEEEEETKKNKKDDGASADKKEEVVEGEVVEGEGERKKKRQRGKKKSAQRGTKTEDGQPRFVLFVGSFLSPSSFLLLLTQFP
jgi:nucleolar protein 6